MAEEGEGTTEPQTSIGEGAAAAAGNQGEGGNPPSDGDQKDGGNVSEGAGQQQGGDKASGDGDGEASSVPETYEWNMPEGMAVDEVMAGAFDPVLRDLGLSQEQADKMTAAYAEAITKITERDQAWMAERAASWIADMKADKNYGGDKLDENLATAREVAEKIGGADFTAALEEMGMQNHPAMFRFLMSVNRWAPVKDDQPGSGGAAASGPPKADYEKLYPDMPVKR